jgi:hypothetical protein
MDLNTIEAKIEKIKDGKPVLYYPLFYKGSKRDLPVYEIPVELLRFNILNGRIASDVLEYKSITGTDLSHLGIDEVNDLISEWIWNKSITDNEMTLDDIKTKTQIIPGVVTRDGILVEFLMIHMKMEVIKNCKLKSLKLRFKWAKTKKLNMALLKSILELLVMLKTI